MLYSRLVAAVGSENGESMRAGVDVAARQLPQRVITRRNRLPVGVWRDALAAWLAQRALFIGGAIFWLAVSGKLSGRELFAVWTRWDGVWYAGIARQGYHLPDQAAFSPLFPLLERMLAPLVGGSVEWAGLLIANSACLGAFALLRWLVELEADAVLARRSLLMLALYPLGMFLVADYTEPLFLLFALATFLALRARRWLLAGVFITLATLTRTTGIALLAPFAVARYMALREDGGPLDWARVRELSRSGVIALTPLVALAATHVALSLRFGVWDIVTKAEEYWGRSLDWPWAGLVTAARMANTLWSSDGNTNLLVALLWIGLAVAMLAPSRWPAPKTAIVYMWACLLLSLSTPVHGLDESPLTSIPRYLLAAFPCFVMLARWSLRSRVWLWIALAVNVGLAVALIRLYALGIFLA